MNTILELGRYAYLLIHYHYQYNVLQYIAIIFTDMSGFFWPFLLALFFAFFCQRFNYMCVIVMFYFHTMYVDSSKVHYATF